MKQGYILLEFFLSLTLATIISGLTLATLPKLDRFMALTELNNLYLACFALKQESKLSARTKKIKFNKTGQCYYVENEKIKLSNNVKFAIPPKIKGPPSNPRTRIEKPITFKKNEIKFYKNGNMSSGAIYLTTSQGKHILALTSAIDQKPYINRYINNDGKWHKIE